jgi:hypothetical protein
MGRLEAIDIGETVPEGLPLEVYLETKGSENMITEVRYFDSSSGFSHGNSLVHFLAQDDRHKFESGCIFETRMNNFVDE